MVLLGIADYTEHRPATNRSLRGQVTIENKSINRSAKTSRRSVTSLDCPSRCIKEAKSTSCFFTLLLSGDGAPSTVFVTRRFLKLSVHLIRRGGS